MPDLENTPEVAETTENLATDSFEEGATEDFILPNTDAVAEAIQKARAQEKAKLYPQMEKLQDELASLKKERDERQAKEAERKAQRATREAEAAAERRKQEESELEVRDLLAKKEQEFQSQLAAERAEREKAFALLEREREFQELNSYRQSRLEAERENIVPELIDLVSGNTKDELDASIADLKSRSAKLLESVAQVAQQTRKDMQGARITVPASGPLDNDSDSRSYTPDNISNMSMADYAKNRAKLLGNTNTRGQGLFGN